MYKIEVYHNVKSYKHFEELGVQEAYPNFNVEITISDDDYKMLLCLEILLEGHFYVSGSINCEINKKSLKDKRYGISVEEAKELLFENRDKIDEILKESLYSSVIHSDYIMDIVDNY
jgi:hypothetical protein